MGIRVSERRRSRKGLYLAWRCWRCFHCLLWFVQKDDNDFGEGKEGIKYQTGEVSAMEADA